MARDNYRKVKLIKLLELLRQQTDEQHPMSTNQICQAMEDMGIPCDRRIVTQDVEIMVAVQVVRQEADAAFQGH